MRRARTRRRGHVLADNGMAHPRATRACCETPNSVSAPQPRERAAAAEAQELTPDESFEQMARSGLAALERFGLELEAAFTGAPAPARRRGGPRARSSGSGSAARRGSAIQWSSEWRAARFPSRASCSAASSKRGWSCARRTSRAWSPLQPDERSNGRDTPPGSQRVRCGAGARRRAHHGMPEPREGRGAGPVRARSRRRDPQDREGDGAQVQEAAGARAPHEGAGSRFSREAVRGRAFAGRSRCPADSPHAARARAAQLRSALADARSLHRADRRLLRSRDESALRDRWREAAGCGVRRRARARARAAGPVHESRLAAAHQGRR